MNTDDIADALTSIRSIALPDNCFFIVNNRCENVRFPTMDKTGKMTPEYQIVREFSVMIIEYDEKRKA